MASYGRTGPDDDDEVAGRVLDDPARARRVEDEVDAPRAAVPQSSFVAAAAGHDAQVVRGGQPQDLGHLLGRGRRRRRTGRGTPATASAGSAGRARSSQTLRRSSSTGSAAILRTPPPGRARAPRPGGSDGRCPCAARAPRRTAAASGRSCPGCDSRAGSKAQRSSCMVSRSSSVNIRGHVLRLVHPDPVLAGDRPAVLDAEVEDRAGHLLGVLGLPGDRLVEEHQRVQVAVAGVEDVRDPDAARPGELGDPPQHLGQRRPRDHAVLDDVVGADPADRGERGLAALPEQRPLGLVGGDPDLEGAGRAAVLLDLGELRLHLGRRTVELDDQHRAGAVAGSRSGRPPRPPRSPARPSSRSRPGSRRRR